MTSFKDLGLADSLLQAVEALGFTAPTPVQQLVIPVALSSDSDFIALAQTGTGKTAAFGLPLLQRIDPAKKYVQALILCPTRELCVQVANDLSNYAAFQPALSVCAVYGGADIDAQIKQLRRGAQIVVATPGRLVDLLMRQAIDLDRADYAVLDEADEMLKMGFKEAVQIIMDAAENRKSTWLFSATMPPDVRALANDYMNDPHELQVERLNQNANIEHHYYLCRSDTRFSALKRIVDAHPGIYALIFCRTKDETKQIAEQMIRDGYDAEALHGDLAQPDRDRVMQRFRERNLQLLIATDVAARGIDVSDVSHVIHYGLPNEIEVYTHRSGRTGRAGRKGVSISIVTSTFLAKIPQLERKLGAKFIQKRIPTGLEVCQEQLLHIVRNIRDQEVRYDEIEPFMPQIYEMLKDLSKEELIMRFASVEFNRFLAYYRNAPDINPGAPGSKKTRSADNGAAESKRLFVNIGLMDGVNKRDFLEVLCGDIGIPKAAVGEISLKKSYMHFNVEAGYAREAKIGLEDFTINNRKVRVSEAEPMKEKAPPKKDKTFKSKVKPGKKEKYRF